MSIEKLLNHSVDSAVINHYLQLLAQRQVQLENQVEQLTSELRRGHLQKAELALLNDKNHDAKTASLIVDTAVDSELMEQLLIYLPAIFQYFWNFVSPIELAQMTGANEKPVIPSPYTYPTSAAVSAIIKHIESFPPKKQKVIFNICHNLQKRYSLQTHPVSRFWLKQMEGGRA